MASKRDFWLCFTKSDNAKIKSSSQKDKRNAYLIQSASNIACTTGSKETSKTSGQKPLRKYSIENKARDWKLCRKSCIILCKS